MQYTRLGRSGVMVSRLGLGTMNFGLHTIEKNCFAIMDAAVDAGINFFDTANVYGGRPFEGISEQIIGRWLATAHGKRRKILIATKIFDRIGTGPNDHCLSAYHLRHACEQSLRHLRTDHIDLYQFNRIDPTTSWDEIWQAAEQLTREGKIIYAGSSNFAGWNIAQAQAIADRRNYLGLIGEQNRYNLINRAVELEVLPACQGHGLGFMPWSPLAGGLLAGPDPEDSVRRLSDEIEKKRALLQPTLERYERLCSGLDERPAVIALAWLLANPLVTAPIIGPRTLDQFTSALRALEITLSRETLSTLDELWPRPDDEDPTASAM